MARTEVPIKRYQYDAVDTEQLNGFPPNVISDPLTGIDIKTNNEGIFIGPDFKDHKTVFVIKNEDSAAKTVTFKAGNSYQGVNDLAVTAKVGLTMIWLDSAKFVDKATGEITITTDESTASKLTMFGYEMR